MTLPKGMTIAGVVLALAMVFMDPATVPIVAQLVGDHAAEKIAAAGALIAALGNAIFQQTPPAPPADE